MGRAWGVGGNENVCSSKHAKQSRPHMLTRSHLHLGTGSKVAQEFYICYSIKPIRNNHDIEGGDVMCDGWRGGGGGGQ